MGSGASKRKKAAAEEAARKAEEERKAAAQKAAADKAAAEKAAAEKAAAEKKAKEEKAAAEREAKEKADKDREAAEKAERDREAAEQAAAEEAQRQLLAAEEAERQRLAAEEAEPQRIAAEEEAQQRAEQERIAAEEAEAKRLKEQAAARSQPKPPSQPPPWADPGWAEDGISNASLPNPGDEPELQWILDEMQTAPLPDGWQRQQDEDGRTYFFNPESGESRWVHPLEHVFKEACHYHRQILQDGHFANVESKAHGRSAAEEHHANDWQEVVDASGLRYWQRCVTDDPKHIAQHSMHLRSHLLRRMKTELPHVPEKPPVDQAPDSVDEGDDASADNPAYDDESESNSENEAEGPEGKAADDATALTGRSSTKSRSPTKNRSQTKSRSPTKNRSPTKSKITAKGAGPDQDDEPSTADPNEDEKNASDCKLGSNGGVYTDDFENEDEAYDPETAGARTSEVSTASFQEATKQYVMQTILKTFAKVIARDQATAETIEEKSRHRVEDAISLLLKEPCWLMKSWCCFASAQRSKGRTVVNCQDSCPAETDAARHDSDEVVSADQQDGGFNSAPLSSPQQGSTKQRKKSRKKKNKDKWNSSAPAPDGAHHGEDAIRCDPPCDGNPEITATELMGHDRVSDRLVGIEPASSQRLRAVSKHRIISDVMVHRDPSSKSSSKASSQRPGGLSAVGSRGSSKSSFKPPRPDHVDTELTPDGQAIGRIRTSLIRNSDGAPADRFRKLARPVSAGGASLQGEQSRNLPDDSGDLVDAAMRGFDKPQKTKAGCFYQVVKGNQSKGRPTYSSEVAFNVAFARAADGAKLPHAPVLRQQAKASRFFEQRKPVTVLPFVNDSSCEHVDTTIAQDEHQDDAAVHEVVPEHPDEETIVPHALMPISKRMGSRSSHSLNLCRRPSNQPGGRFSSGKQVSTFSGSFSCMLNDKIDAALTRMPRSSSTGSIRRPGSASRVPTLVPLDLHK